MGFSTRIGAFTRRCSWGDRHDIRLSAADHFVIDLASEESTPFDLLESSTSRVILEWRGLLAREPWSGLPTDRLIDHFPEILPRLFQHASAGLREIDPELQQLISRAHGFFRREDAIPLAAVAEEFDLLKRACWKVLTSSGLAPAEVSAALARLDILIDDATGYTLRGYYAPELDALRGRGLERRSAQGQPLPFADRRHH